MVGITSKSTQEGLVCIWMNVCTACGRHSRINTCILGLWGGEQVILDQSLVTGEHTSWGAQLEYHVVHHNWPQVSALLDAIPHSVMYEGELQVHLGFDETVVLGEADPDVEEAFSPKGGNKEVKTVIPNVHILGIDMRPMSSAWLWHMMDMKLIKNHIFLRTHWQGTAELVSLLASAGLLFHHTSSGDFDNVGKQQSADGMGVHKDSLHKDTVQAFHELVVQHSVKHSLMNLLECYCNHHSLALDEGSATMMQAILVLPHFLLLKCAKYLTFPLFSFNLDFPIFPQFW